MIRLLCNRYTYSHITRFDAFVPRSKNNPRPFRRVVLEKRNVGPSIFVCEGENKTTTKTKV